MKYRQYLAHSILLLGVAFVFVLAILNHLTTSGVAVSANSAEVLFVSTDTTTQGNWKGAYGSDGYSIINDSTSLPAYATFSQTGAYAYTWLATTTDVRALLKGATTTRIAASTYGESQFVLNLNLTDGAFHQVAFYLLDWDNKSRALKVEIIDVATNQVLDTQNVSAFTQGKYLVYSIKGNVKIKFTRTLGTNAVFSGIFFAPPTQVPNTYATPYTTPYETPYGTPVGGTGYLTPQSYAYETPYGTPYVTPYPTPYTTPYATPYATPYPIPASTTKIKIMPIGDSITYGIGMPNYGGYRVKLYNLLTSAGFNFDFVGGVSSGPSTLPDKDNQGGNGWTLGEMNTVVHEWLNYQNPDVILLMGGTNDVLRNLPTPQNTLTTLIDKIFTTKPNITVVVGSIVPIAGKEAQVNTFNSYIPGIVDARFQAGKKIYFANINPAVTVADLPDTIHPNETGYNKMADAWFIKLSEVLANAAPTPPTPPAAEVSYVKTDTTAKGNWKGVYGADGYQIIGDSASMPSYATLSPTNNSPYTWTTSTTDIRALEKGVATGRIASSWYNATNFTLALNMAGTDSHQVAIYMLDWDNGGRSERVEITDANTGTVLDTRDVTAFTQGKYLVYNIKGNVKIKVTKTAGVNAIISGIFFR